MINYKEPRIQLINAPLNELKSEVRKTKTLEQHLRKLRKPSTITNCHINYF